MRTADGGGYGGHWSLQTVKGLWPMLENQDTNAHWRHVAGWKKVYELTSQHLTRMRRYREGLVAAWPPERSEAARAYVERLDFLIETVQRTYDTAVANHETFRAATLAIGDSRHELKTIHDEYVAMERIKQEHESRLRTNPAAATTDIPPVTDQDLDVLNKTAQTVMARLSTDLSLAQTRIQQPPTYRTNKGHEPDIPDQGSGSSFPAIPLIVPTPSAPSHTYSANPRNRVSRPSPPTSQRAGPTLGSADTPQPNRAADGALPKIPAPGTPLVHGNASGNPPIITPATPQSNRSHTPSSSNNSSTNTHTLSGSSSGPARAIPPGGIIGGLPSAPQGGRSEGSPGNVRRINSVGGLINGFTPASANAIQSGNHQSSYNSDDKPGLSWELDSPWQSDRGVDPIVGAVEEVQHIDPGPAIGTQR
nr:hypothetical protein [Micromonospora sp. DSM 115978]